VRRPFGLVFFDGSLIRSFSIKKTIIQWKHRKNAPLNGIEWSSFIPFEVQGELTDAQLKISTLLALAGRNACCTAVQLTNLNPESSQLARPADRPHTFG
jgi:hypothetical protein